MLSGLHVNVRAQLKKRGALRDDDEARLRMCSSESSRAESVREAIV
jgi:hypothetical protein